MMDNETESPSAQYRYGYENGFKRGLEAAARWHEKQAKEIATKPGGGVRTLQHQWDAEIIRDLTDPAIEKVIGDG